MTSFDSPLVARMTGQISQWEVHDDQRAVFLSCYCMMTRNMQDAIEQHEFEDPIGLTGSCIVSRITISSHWRRSNESLSRPHKSGSSPMPQREPRT